MDVSGNSGFSSESGFSIVFTIHFGVFPYDRKHPCIICIVYVYTIKRETSRWESLRVWKVHSKRQLGSIGLVALTRMLLSVVHLTHGNFQHFELEHGVFFVKHVFFTQDLSKTSNIHIGFLSQPRQFKRSLTNIASMWGIWTSSLYQIGPLTPQNSGWWQLKCCLFSSRKLGKISNLTNIFQLGWNHQPEIYKQIEIP